MAACHDKIPSTQKMGVQLDENRFRQQYPANSPTLHVLIDIVGIGPALLINKIMQHNLLHQHLIVDALNMCFCKLLLIKQEARAQ